MSHIFISYSHLNSKYAYQLADKFRQKGFDVWIDDAEIHGGDDWFEAIALAIRTCAAFIIIMTPEAQISRWVQKEVALAEHLNKPIFPMLLSGSNWDRFLPTQYEDVRTTEGISPDYVGKLPSEKFFNKVFGFVYRREKGETTTTDKIDVYPTYNSLSLILKFLMILALLIALTLQVIILNEIRQFIPLLVFLDPNAFIIVDQREVLGEVFTEQTGNIDNSTSAEDLSQDIAVRREFNHSITLRMNEGATLDRQNVEENILETYDIPMTDEKICIIPADVPAGAIYQYEIEWTQVFREGNIEERSRGNIVGTYSVIIDLQCQVVGVNVIQG
jgi:hypothetical protein